MLVPETVAGTPAPRIHVVPTRVYYVIFGILMFCTYLTVQIAFFDLGIFNTSAALAIAVFKATLVVLFFMHVRYSGRLIWLVIVAALLWLAIMFAITFSDYWTRMWLAPFQS
jgi:cytochrome c oxidase subunit 4